jgi:hypothetical protein
MERAAKRRGACLLRSVNQRWQAMSMAGGAVDAGDPPCVSRETRDKRDRPFGEEALMAWPTAQGGRHGARSSAGAFEDFA